MLTQSYKSQTKNYYKKNGGPTKHLVFRESTEQSVLSGVWYDKLGKCGLRKLQYKTKGATVDTRGRGQGEASKGERDVQLQSRYVRWAVTVDQKSINNQLTNGYRESGVRYCK